MQVKSKNITEILKDISLLTTNSLNLCFNPETLVYNQNEYLTIIKGQTFLQRVDQLECFMLKNFQPIYIEPEHDFSPGLYTRTLTMPAGCFCTSKIHKTEHQYRVLSGECTVWVNDQKGIILRGGDKGITYPGTKRRLLIHTETKWMTMHPTNKTTVEEVEEEIIEKHVNEYMRKMLLSY